MELKAAAIKELAKIMLRDYGVDFSEEEIRKFGLSMLKVYRLASVALARLEQKQKDEKHKSQLRGESKEEPGKRKLR